MPLDHPRIVPNWTSAAGALQGILEHLEATLPGHAVMGLTALAWHSCLGTREGVTALPSGPSDLDWERLVRSLDRLGYRWERFGAVLAEETDRAPSRQAAIAWAIAHIDAGRPIAGWDFHLHEFAIVHGYDSQRRGFLVDDLLTEPAGPFVPWDEWPSALGRIELWAPLHPVEVDPLEALTGALQAALDAFAGRDGPADGQPRGTAALDAWAEALDGQGEVDRAGHAYTLHVLQAARLDGAAFLADLAEAVPGLADPLHRAERAVRDLAKALSPLITLFPFPAAGHGNLATPGLRRAAAMALRRAAAHERVAANAIVEAAAALMGSEPT